MTELQDIGPNYNLTSNTSAVPGVFWTPPTQPSALVGDGDDFGFGITADVVGWDYAGFLSLYEALRAANPGYITRSSPGKDASGTLDWWVYSFTPPSYEKTMIIEASIHGGEVTATLGLFRFLYHMCQDWKTYPALAYIRNKVRLIVMPMCNPWGTENGRATKNYNAVNLVRNFAYNWSDNPSDPGDDNYRGASTFSEVETQYIRDTIIANSDAYVFIDVHNLGNNVANLEVYTPLKFTYDGVMLRRVIRWVQPDLAEVVNLTTDLGISINDVANTHGMHCFLLEFPDGQFSTIWDSTEMTHAVLWYGNMILQAAAISAKPVVSEVQHPHTWYGYYSQTSTAMEINSVSNSELTDLRLTLAMPGTGILLITGEVVIQNASGGSAICYVTPEIFQDGSDFALINVQRHQNYATIPDGSYATIPFSCVARVLFSNTAAVNPVEAQVRMNAQASATFTFVNRYRCTVTWLPSTAVDALTIYSAVDRNGLGSSAMLQEYP